MTRDVRLVQAGVGTVGSEVVRLVLAKRKRWLDVYDIDVRYYALADSQGYLVCLEHGIASGALEEALHTKATGCSLLKAPSARHLNNELDTLVAQCVNEAVVFLDCASGDETYMAHLQAAQAEGSSVLCNKAPLTVDQKRHDTFLRLAFGSPDADARSIGDLVGKVWYEATVGAGLPVISTLRALLAAGDEVREIRACASGTLGYITSELMAGWAYSEAVATAKGRGYTEPDPRDDLSGLDVARKALILARTFGRRLELADIRVEPLMPTLDPGLSVDALLAALPAADAEFAEKVARARSSGSSLKYVATIPAEGEITVGLKEMPAGSQMGSLAGPDNIFVFRTRAYDENPLTIIGPGAGPRVTAMGVVGDILQAARR